MQEKARLWSVLMVSVLGAVACQDVPQDNRMVDSSDMVLPLGQTRMVFLNRGGGTYMPSDSLNDSVSNTTTVLDVKEAVTLPPYQGSEAFWAQTVSCVRDQFAQYNIVFVEKEPESLHIEIAVGGTSRDLMLMDKVEGIAPQRSDCQPLERGLGFVFSESGLYKTPETLCWGMAHELGHILGLGHSLHCDENMSYIFPACAFKHFTDDDLPCGRFQEEPCVCGESQNSHQHLLKFLGPPAEVSSFGASGG